VEEGDRIPIKHPEDIAFDPGHGPGSGSLEFDVISDRLRVFGTFAAVTGIASAESEEELA
jgi:hypothetical protein